MLRRLLPPVLFLILLTLPGLALAGDSAASGAAPAVGPADRAAIRAVISHQLGAFRHDDGQAAFADASPTIQHVFGDAATFMQMVRTGYQPVYRASGVEFRELGPVDGRLIQQVYMVGPDGIPVIARYEMQRQPDGSWRINGCSIARAPDQGV
jgi:Domain of unknown function (DUF4864)